MVRCSREIVGLDSLSCWWTNELSHGMCVYNLVVLVVEKAGWLGTVSCGLGRDSVTVIPRLPSRRELAGVFAMCPLNEVGWGRVLRVSGLLRAVWGKIQLL